MEKMINIAENKTIVTVTEKRPLNNIREVVEIRLHTNAEIETAKEHGHQVFYRDIKLPTDETVRIFFIYISFFDIINLNRL